MKIIFGLGNPGRTYRNNRHNIGYQIVESFALQESVKFRLVSDLRSHIATLDISDEQVVLIKPVTFMNNSGVSAKLVLNKFAASLDDILVVYDDADMEIGAMRYRLNGTSAGHKGLKSIIEHLETTHLRRLKIGIGRPVRNQDPEKNEPDDLAAYVLEDFTKSDLKIIDEILPCAVCACRDWVQFGDEYITKHYNKRGGNSG